MVNLRTSAEKIGKPYAENCNQIPNQVSLPEGKKRKSSTGIKKLKRLFCNYYICEIPQDVWIDNGILKMPIAQKITRNDKQEGFQLRCTAQKIKEINN